MKRIIYTIVLFVAGCSVAKSQSTDSDVFIESIYTYFETGDYEKADSVLKIWEQSGLDCPELYIARSNYLVYVSRVPFTIVPEDSDPQNIYRVINGEETDDTVIRKWMWDDNVFSEAIKTLDRGIAKYPDREDLRLHKVWAYEARGDWNKVVDALSEAADYEMTPGTKWFWGDGQDVSDEGFILGNILNYVGELSSTDNREPIHRMVEIAQRCYPNNFKVLNMSGQVKFEEGETADAIKEYKKALEQAPDDVIIMQNLGIAYAKIGELAESIRLFNKILDNSQASESFKKFAQSAIDQCKAAMQE